MSKAQPSNAQMTAKLAHSDNRRVAHLHVMPKQFVLIVAALCASAQLCAESSGKFGGRIVVEWLDTRGSHAPMKLLEDFAFEDARGHNWLAEKDHVVEGNSIPPLFRSLVGPPFSGDYRRAAVLHDFYTEARSEKWEDVRRMFYAASLASGIGETDAKVMYMALYAEAPRWELRSSSCFSHCHAARSALVWRPVINENDFRPVVEWIDQDNPSLDQIDEKVGALIKKPGPHIFVQGHEPTGK